MIYYSEGILSDLGVGSALSMSSFGFEMMGFLGTLKQVNMCTFLVLRKWRQRALAAKWYIEKKTSFS